jgi:hypothetical protein
LCEAAAAQAGGASSDAAAFDKDAVREHHYEQFIIELKLWHGEAAYEQLAGYLRSKGAPHGYLVTLDLRKGANCEAWVGVGDLRLFDVVL